MNGFKAHRFVLFAMFFVALACVANAQDKASADENFTLNITDERISENNYERSTAVEVGDEKTDLQVRVGVSVRADTITLTLRGITGNVRFRASLEKISRVLERSRLTNAER